MSAALHCGCCFMTSMSGTITATSTSFSESPYTNIWLRRVCHVNYNTVFPLQLLSVNGVHLCDKGGRDKNVFDLLGGYVLALAQLENVFLSVDDLQSAVGKELACCRVSRAVRWGGVMRHAPMSPLWSQPSASRASAVCSGSFKYNTLGVLCINLGFMNLEVSTKNIGTFEANFASGVAPRVVRDVIHLRNVHQLDVVARHRAPHVPSAGVAQLRDGGGSTALGLTISLDERAAHGDTQEVHDVACDGRRARDHQPAAAAQDGFSVLENDLVPQPVRVSASESHAG
jgi:hypothetical protein